MRDINRNKTLEHPGETAYKCYLDCPIRAEEVLSDNLTPDTDLIRLTLGFQPSARSILKRLHYSRILGFLVDVTHYREHTDKARHVRLVWFVLSTGLL